VKLKNILIVVDDVERSKNFYCHLFGLRVVTDFGGNVILTEGLVLQERKLWDGLIGESSISRRSLPQITGHITLIKRCKIFLPEYFRHSIYYTTSPAKHPSFIGPSDMEPEPSFTAFGRHNPWIHRFLSYARPGRRF